LVQHGRREDTAAPVAIVISHTDMQGETMENEFTIGQVLGKSFNIFGKNFGFMLIVAALSTIPDFIIELMPQESMLVLASTVINNWVGLFFQGIVVFGVFQHLTGKRMVFADSFNVAMRCFFPLLLTSIVVGFLTSLGFLLLIIPGVIISLMMWVAVPVVIVERGGVGHALQRSKDLTTGYRSRIFMISLIMGVITIVAVMIQYGMTEMLLGMGVIPGTLTAALINFPISILLLGTILALSSVVVTVGYYSLRHEVEGVAPEDLASVFE
jgi:hypothetical protein